nr:YbaK/EbsC family protein [Nocardioides jensenii]
MTDMSLDYLPALDRLDLVAAPVATALRGWPHAGEVLVAEIDPSLADTAAMTEAYGTDLTDSANCVVISGKRSGEERLAACVVRADTKADVNNLVKRTLDVRKCSFHPMERAVDETGMEYGGITPIGLPVEWRLLVDTRVLEIERAIIGTGVRRSKLFLPGRLLAELPGAEVIDDLGRAAVG